MTPRRPLALDKVLLDYEVDSDEEWEEEPEGEDLGEDAMVRGGGTWGRGMVQSGLDSN